MVDVDPRNGGSWESVADLPETLCARTPGGGWHLYFWGTRPSATGWRAGVDVKSLGGFVVVPTVGVSDRSWVDSEVAVAELPPSLRAAPDSRSNEPASGGRDEHLCRPRGRNGGDWVSSGYGSGALLSEAYRVREAVEGERNDVLYQAALRMGQLIGAGELSEDESFTELRDAGVDSGLGSDEVDRTINNGHLDGRKIGREDVPSKKKKEEVPVSVIANQVCRDSEGRIDIVWGVDGTFWHYVDGVWKPYMDRDSIVCYRMCDLLGDDFHENLVGSVEKYVRYLVPRIKPQPDTRYINFRNGMLNIMTGEFSAHDREFFSTVQLGVDYLGEDVDTSEFDNFLSTVVNEDVVSLVWEMIAYAMYSANPLEKAFMLVGPERSGKGTTLKLVETILGAANVTAFSLQKLASDRFATASLVSTTANICGDIDPDHVPHPGFLKSLTGGDTVQAEHKGKAAFQFEPWVTLFFGANKPPTTSDVTSSYFNRWVIVPYSVSWLGREDVGLKKRMSSPGVASAVASRAVREYLPALLERAHFSKSDTAGKAAASFRKGLNSAESWIAECCEDGNAVYRGKDLYEAYRLWCQDGGFTPMNKTNLQYVLDAHFDRGVAEGKRGWRLTMVD